MTERLEIRQVLWRSVRRLGALSILICPALLAAETDCSRYSEFGLRLGMSSKQVWQAMGRRGEVEGRTRNSSGYRSIERYDKDSAPLLVHYDGLVGKKSTARVVSIETTFEENVVDIPDLIANLRSRLGEPDAGASNLDSGLRDGPVQWSSPDCDAQVTLFRRAASWWEPAESAEFHVKIDSLSFVRPDATTPESEQADARSADTEGAAPPRDAPVAPTHAEIAMVSAEAVNGTDTGPDRGSAPDPSDTYIAGLNDVSHPVRLKGKAEARRLPTSLRARGIIGQVVMEVTVLKDGTVGDVIVLQVSPTDLGLEQIALRSVRKWRYAPAELDGRPVDARTTVSFRVD